MRHDKERSFGFEAALKSQERIGKLGGPRCCRLSAYVAIEQAIKYLKKFDYYFEHLKEEGYNSGIYKVHYWTGKFNGRVPYNFIYFMLKLLYHIFDKPFMIGTFIQFYSYIESRYITKERPFPQEISAYVRKEQKEKLKYFLKK